MLKSAHFCCRSESTRVDILLDEKKDGQYKEYWLSMYAGPNQAAQGLYFWVLVDKVGQGSDVTVAAAAHFPVYKPTWR